MRWIKWGSYALGCLLFILGSVELAGMYIAPDIYRVITTDVDHRMKPYESDDVNEDGLRTTFSVNDISDTDYNIIMLGDSFVYGVFIDTDSTIPSRLQDVLRKTYKRNDINVINFGWISSSPLLSYRLLEDIGYRYKPDAIILCFDMTDFHNEIFYRKLLAKDGAFWSLRVIPMSSFLLWQFLTSQDYLEGIVEAFYGVPAQLYFPALRPLDESRRYLSYSQESILAIRDYAVDRGIPFSLVVLPRNFQYSDRESPDDWQKDIHNMRTEPLGTYALEAFRFFREWEAEVDFPVISLLEDFQDPALFPTTLRYDLHFNEKGAGLAARFIHKHCQGAGCFRGLEPAPLPEARDVH